MKSRGALLLTPILLAVFFIIIYSYHSIHRHLNFKSHAYDLGIYTQITYLYSRGYLLPFSSIMHRPSLADHFEPILFTFSPVFILFSSAVTLLVLQAIFVALSSIPIYFIALDKLKNRFLSTLITVLYFTSQPITNAVDFDFHPSTISVLPLSLMLYTWYFKKWRLYFLSLFLGLLFKEDIPIFVIGLGLFQILKSQFRIGTLTTIVGLLSLYLIKFRLMPLFWPGGNDPYLATLILPLTSPIDMFAIIITRPSLLLDQIFNVSQKLDTLELLVKPLAFLPLLSPLFWLTVFPYLYLRFSSNFTALWGMSFHHNANLEPFIIVASIFSIFNFKLPRKPMVLLIFFFLVSSGFFASNIIWETINSTVSDFQKYNYIQKSLLSVPANAAVSAQSPLVPHLAARVKIYLYPDISDANFIVLDTSLSTYPLKNKEFQEKLSAIKKSGLWKEVLKNKSMIIFKKIESKP